MTGEQIKQAQAAAEDLKKRLCRLSEQTEQLYNAVSQVDSEAYDLSYDVIHLRNMLETDDEEGEK